MNSALLTHLSTLLNFIQPSASLRAAPPDLAILVYSEKMEMRLSDLVRTLLLSYCWRASQVQEKRN